MLYVLCSMSNSILGAKDTAVNKSCENSSPGRQIFLSITKWVNAMKKIKSRTGDQSVE